MSIESTRVRPMGRRIICVPVESDTQTPGGIIIPDSAREPASEYIVIAVGPGNFNYETKEYEPVRGVSVGDHVLLARYVGSDVNIEVDGTQTGACILLADDILCVV